MNTTKILQLVNYKEGLAALGHREIVKQSTGHVDAQISFFKTGTFILAVVEAGPYYSRPFGSSSKVKNYFQKS